LDKAAQETDPAMRMALVSAWVVSGYCIAVRTKKPFNPFLGETFEYISPDKRFKFLGEQVSHHPPISIGQADSDEWEVLLEMELKTKFRGNSSDVIVNGSNHLWLKKFNEHYSWGHIDSCAHNIIIGGMWVDHFGTLEIKVQETGMKAVINFAKCGWLGSGRYDLNGDILNPNGNKKLKLTGKWNDFINVSVVTESGDGPSSLLWKKFPATDHKWLWSKFTQSLNDFDSNYEGILPREDSRLRLDRKYLQLDNLEIGGKEKHKLEEVQRAKRKERETKNEEWVTKYYEKVEDAVWGHRYRYFGKYWEEREERVKRFEEEKLREKVEEKVEEKLEKQEEKNAEN